jgi:3-methylcrotonyl-CoA carboxylase alpha subunit
MIAKLIVHGPTRAVALRKLEQVLATTQVAGSVTNLAFLRRLAGHRGFAAGAVDTGLIGRDLDQLAAPLEPGSQVRALAAMGALGLTGVAGPLEGFGLWGALRRSVRLRYEAEVFDAVVEVMPGGTARVSLDGLVHEVARTGMAWHVDGAAVGADVVPTSAGITVFWDDGFSFEIIDPLDVAVGNAAGGGVIEAPMPGLVKAVFVAPGDRVAAGDRLAVLEAMKMEHALNAGRDGVVAEVLVEVGGQVAAGAALIRLEDEA